MQGDYHNMEKEYKAIFAQAMSVVTHKPSQYARNITLRYPMTSTFDGDQIRICMDNYTGKEGVIFDSVTVGRVISGRDLDPTSIQEITFNGEKGLELDAGEQCYSDAIDFKVHKGETIAISYYLKSYTHLRCGVFTQGPLSIAYFGEGDFSHAGIMDHDLSMKTPWVFFLSEVAVLTDASNKVITCYGDSITSQDWPDYLQKLMWKNHKNVSVVRKAVSGTRILRQYSCIQYESYGLKGDYRFGHEMHVAGSDTVIILQGINDIIHPVGIEKNEFRPWQDLPSSKDLIDGLRRYIKYAKSIGLKVYVGTLIPIEGWRTYAHFRENLRNEVNAWIRSTDEIDGFIDFDKDICQEHKMIDAFDSGDHLHPSAKGYEQMAKTAYETLSKDGGLE